MTNITAIPESVEDTLVIPHSEYFNRCAALLKASVERGKADYELYKVTYRAKQHFRKFKDFTEAAEYITSMCPKGCDALYQMYEGVANTLDFKHTMAIYLQDGQTFANDFSEGCVTVIIHGDETHWYVPSRLPRIVAGKMRKAMKEGYPDVMFEYYPQYVSEPNPNTEAVGIIVTDEVHEPMFNLDNEEVIYEHHPSSAEVSYEERKRVMNDDGDSLTVIIENHRKACEEQLGNKYVNPNEGLKRGELNIVAGLASSHNSQEHTRQLLGRLKSQSIQITMESDTRLDIESK